MKNNDDMKKTFFSLLLLCCLAQGSMAQAPKWVEKAKRAVISIVTYNGEDKILKTGNGFFVSEDGVALSDYTLFEGAVRAVILDYEGKQMPVESIMGADDMYDVIKFRVGITEKSVPALPLVSVAPAVGEEVYLLPYSTQKDRSCTIGKVQTVDNAGANNNYYTLSMRLKDKMLSCPVVNGAGEVFGISQKSSGQDTASICYAVDARHALSLDISALSYTDMSLRNIGIKKALPPTEEQALVFLYMAASQMTPERYAGLLDDFIAQYPQSADGYLRRASNRLLTAKDEAAMAAVKEDLDKALEVAVKKDDVYYNRAKLIYGYLLQNPGSTYNGWSMDEALTEIQEAVRINPLPVYVQLEGDIQIAREDYAAALACYDQVNRSNLSSAATLYTTGKIKEWMGAPKEEVVAMMDSCVALYTPPYTQEAAPYLLARAESLMNAGRPRDAIRDYDAYFTAVKGNVNDAFYYYREQAALQGKQYQRALDDLAKAIELNPQNLLYKAELAVVNIRVGRSEEAIKVLQEAIAQEPGYAEAYRLMGLAQLQLKQKDKACESFAKAKELGDPHVDALIEKHCK